MKNKKNWIELITSLIVFLFLYTSITKFMDLNTFRFSLGMSPLIKSYAVPLSILIPTLELIITILLVLPKTRKYGLYSSAALLLAFTLYLSYMVTFTKDLPCGCGGVINLLSWKQHIAFNSFFLIINCIAIKLQKSSPLNLNIPESKLTT